MTAARSPSLGGSSSLSVICTPHLHHKPRAGVRLWASGRGREGAQQLAGLVDVAPDLLDEGLHRVEPDLVAQPGDEPDLGVLAVEVAVEVQEVGLQQADVGLDVE